MSKFMIFSMLLILAATSDGFKLLSDADERQLVAEEVNDRENEILDDAIVDKANNIIIKDKIAFTTENTIEDTTNLEEEENSDIEIIYGTTTEDPIENFFGSVGSILDSLGDTVSKIVDESIDIAGEVVQSPQMTNVTRSAGDLLKNTGSLFKKVLEMKDLFRNRVVETIRRRNDVEE